MNNKEKRSLLGCNKAPEDSRDYILRARRGLKLLEGIDHVDYTEEMVPVKDQGFKPTCVGFAISAMKEWQEKRELGGKDIILSPRFIYEEARKIDEIDDSIGGTNLRSAIKVLKRKGICTEELWPYTGSGKEDFHGEAARYRIASYGKIPGNMEKRSALVTNGPFVVGLSVFDNWYSPGVNKTGIIPEPDGEGHGGHAVCVVGYDDNEERFKFRNSWSEKWGDSGYGYISYEYMEKHSFDAWTSIDMTVPLVPAAEEEEDLKDIAKEVIKEFLAEQKVMPVATADIPITEIIIRIDST